MDRTFTAEAQRSEKLVRLKLEIPSHSFETDLRDCLRTMARGPGGGVAMTDLGILRRQEIGGVSIVTPRSREAYHLDPYV